MSRFENGLTQRLLGGPRLVNRGSTHPMGTSPVGQQTRFRLGVACGIIQWVSGFPPGATAMTLTVEAIYENGVLKPAQPLPLQEHEKVRITVEAAVSHVRRSAGL